ncbi:MAG: polyphosphate kinase 2, partial [Flavobacteriales bacterium CG_4_9_14_0_2_um_filter_35_242]
MKKQKITGEELINLKSVSQLRQLLSEKEIDTTAVDRILDYESDLKLLQIELVKLQQWVLNNRKRVIIIFEGRDAAGKGGIIRRFTEHLNPRSVRQVALNKPTEIERGQWYFRRYV